MRLWPTTLSAANLSHEHVLTPAKLRKAVVWLVGFLIAAHCAVMTLRYGFGFSPRSIIVMLFNLDHEHNFPSLISTLLLAACSFQLAVLSRSTRERPLDRLAWLALAVIFAFLSADEWFSFHEHLGALVPHNIEAGSGVLFFAWIVPYGIATLVIGAIFLPWLFRLDARTRNRILVAGFVYVSGAVGFEMLGGEYYSSLPQGVDFADGTPIGDLLATVEETLEFTGTVLFLMVLFERLCGKRSGLRWHVPSWLVGHH